MTIKAQTSSAGSSPLTSARPPAAFSTPQRVNNQTPPVSFDSPSLPALEDLATQAAALLWIADTGLDADLGLTVDLMACHDLLERSWRCGNVLDSAAVDIAALELLAECGVLRS